MDKIKLENNKYKHQKCPCCIRLHSSTRLQRPEARSPFSTPHYVCLFVTLYYVGYSDPINQALGGEMTNKTIWKIFLYNEIMKYFFNMVQQNIIMFLHNGNSLPFLFQIALFLILSQIPNTYIIASGVYKSLIHIQSFNFCRPFSYLKIWVKM